MDELREFLRVQNLNQDEFAKQVGVTQGAVSQWLSKGEVPPRKAARVSALTGIPIEKLCADLTPVQRAS